MPVSRASTLFLLLIVELLTINSAISAEPKNTAGSNIAANNITAAEVQPATAMDRVNAHLSANPKDLQAMFIRAVMLAEQNKREEAIKAFTEITEKYPRLPEPFNNLAVLYADQGQYDKAKKALESAIKTHPSYATAHENLGDIYAKMASEAYDKALQLDTSNTRAQGKLSLIKDIFITGGKPPANIKLSDATSPAPVLPPAKNDVAPAKTADKAVDIKAPDNKIADNKPADKPVATSKPTEPAPIADNTQDIRDTVMQWAQAWSSKDLNRYLDSYASSFQPPDGLSRSAWEQSRRQRINKPAAIKVDVSNIRVKLDGSNRAKASFKQSYRSGGMAQRTNKTLSMVKTSGKWQIEQESTDK